jgi:hypothetical protein
VSFSFPGGARPDLDALRGDLEHQPASRGASIHLAQARP